MKKTILTTALLFLISGISFGQIAAWETNGLSGNEVSVNATTLNANLQTSTLSRGAGLNASSLGNSFSSTNFTALGGKADAISNNKYLQFAITPKSGYKVSLSTLDANFRRSSSGPNAFQWQYSLDGFATAGVDIGSAISYTGTTSDGAAQTQIVLSGIAALQDVENKAISIRLYGWGASGTSGTFAIGKLTGNDLSVGGTVTSTAGAPTKLAVTAVNSSKSPSVGTAFDVTVQAQDASNLPSNVSGAVNVTLSKATGAGTLGGTLTGTIADGTNQITISGVTFDTAETGVSITVADNDEALTSGTSATFTVLTAADKLVFGSVPSKGKKNSALSSFTVTAQRSGDSSTDLNYTKNITISKVTGVGVIGGNLTKAAVAGVATFDNVTFDTDGDYTIQATDGSLTTTEPNPVITISSPDFVENFDNATDLTGTYKNDSFVGANGITWTYTDAATGAGNNTNVNGTAIQFRDANGKITSNTISGGISNISVKLYKGSSVATLREVELFVNGVSKGTSPGFNDDDEHIFTVENINIGGDVVIEIKNIKSAHVIVDDISWFKYDDGTYNLTVSGNEGWRMLSSPTSDNTYADLLGSIWTQGFPGANYEVNDVDPSVREFKASPIDSFEVITNLSNPMTPGQGFITYVYQDDVYDPLNPGTGTFPKTLTLTGTENSGTITPTLNSGADAWTLVGNPYASIIEWGNDIVKTDLTGVAYVYDHSYDPIVEIGKDTLANPEAGGGYRTWNGTAGGLKDGKIATFQGFWVQNAATITTGPVLEITEDAKSVSGNKFYKQSTQSASFRMIAQMDGFANDAYFSFTNEGKIGKDNYDGLKLEPLDYADYLSLGTEVEGVLMDINNLPWDIKESVEFPVEINSFTKLDDGYALKGGEVTLSLADLKNIPADWGIVFNNYNTGETIDLRTQESYTFQLAAKAKMVKAKTAFSVLSPAGITREKSMGSSGFSITIQPDKTPVNLEPKDEPRVFALEQNYPNPFNPTTTIKYSVAETGAVSLAVYNIMGQKVADLVNSTKQAGNYAISWQAQDMASGLYFYRLSAAGQTITRQMTLIK